MRYLVHSVIAAQSIAWIILELGGKSPLIICDDAIDLDEAVDIAHAAIFNNHGQNCCAGSRTFVQAGIYDKFVAKAKAKAEGRKVGDPWTDVEQGPQVCVYYDVQGRYHDLNLAKQKYEISTGQKNQCFIEWLFTKQRCR